MVSPAALEAAKYLERTYGTPYETGYPLVDELVYDMDYHGKKVLIVQQQVIGSAIRKEIQKSKGCTGDSCKLVYDKARALQ